MEENTPQPEENEYAPVGLPENTQPIEHRSPRKPFVIKSSTDGQQHVNILTRRGNIGANSETYTQRAGAVKAIRSMAKSVYYALQTIDFDFSRIEEIIDDQTKKEKEDNNGTVAN